MDFEVYVAWAKVFLEILGPIAGVFIGLGFGITIAKTVHTAIHTVHNAQKDKNESKNPERLARPSWHEDHLGEEFYYENQLVENNSIERSSNGKNP